VQMGTRFVATHECDADIAFKQSYVNASEQDLVLIESPVGLPGRALRNKFIEDVKKGKKTPYKCPYHCITTCNHKDSPYCIAMALSNAKKGKLDLGFSFAGKNAYRVEGITSVKELINSLVGEFEQASFGCC
jgi:nitronate monooxygenase